MAQLGQRFDASAIDTEARDYEELPNGIYQLETTVAEIKPTANGNGTILKITDTVLAPEAYRGRLLFSNINIENQNAQAQEIGQRDLAMRCRALGLTGVDDTDELRLIAFTAKVGLGKPQYEKKPDGTFARDAGGNLIEKYPARAEIKRYYYPDQGDIPEPGVLANPANDNRPAPRAATPAARPAQAAAAPAKTANPWSKK